MRSRLTGSQLATQPYRVIGAVFFCLGQGRTQGEDPGARALPLAPIQQWIFRISSVKVCHSHRYSMCVSDFCYYMWEDRASLQHGSGLTLG